MLIHKREPLVVAKLSISILCAVLASGCANNPSFSGISQELSSGTDSIGKNLKDTFDSDNPCSHSKRNIGILAGVVAGAVIGNQFDHSIGARLAGAAVGATAGGFIGDNIDKRECEIWKIGQKNHLDMHIETIHQSQVGDAPQQQQPNQTKPQDSSVGVDVALTDNGGQFASGSDALTPEARNYFRQLARQYSYTAQKSMLSQNASQEDIANVEAFKNKRIMLVGHTDDTGSSKLNADLSEQRAKAVAKIFEAEGIPESHLYFQGAGEILPIADNHTDQGRAKNRRVEIVDVRSDSDLKGYLVKRNPHLAYYRMSENMTRHESFQETPTQHDVVPRKKEVKAHDVVEPKIRKLAKARSSQEIDFDGNPVAKLNYINIGSTEKHSAFSIVSNANAADTLIPPCVNDRYRASHGVKSLASGREFDTSDYLPGLYGGSWVAMSNRNLVALTHVAVLRDGGLPAEMPKLLVYRDYSGNRKQKPAFSSSMNVNAYRGDRAVLYRVFGSGPLTCMDLVIPNNSPSKATGSTLYYDKGNSLYSASIAPSLANNYSKR